MLSLTQMHITFLISYENVVKHGVKPKCKLYSLKYKGLVSTNKAKAKLKYRHTFTKTSAPRLHTGALPLDGTDRICLLSHYYGI